VDTVTANRNSLPKISEVFSDPYDPEKSLWIHSELRKDLKECFVEADGFLARGKIGLAKKPVEMIAAQLPQGARDQYLKRLTYNYYYLRHYAPRIGNYDVPRELKNQFISANKEQAVFDGVETPTALNDLVRRTRRETRQLYGADVLRSGTSVRYASRPSASPYRSEDQNDTNRRLLSAMHLDEKKGITSIVYLTDVNEKSGCFSYLEGSHQLKQSLTIRTFHETLDNDLGINSPEQARQHGIPAELAGTLEYAKNFPSEKLKIAEQYVVKVVGPAGTAVSFTGNTLIHGGGWPIAGERVAVFISHVGMIGHRAQYLIPYFIHFKLAA
jgi:hypothetical protein